MRRLAGEGRPGGLTPDHLDEFSSEVEVRPRVPAVVTLFESVPAYSDDAAASWHVPPRRRRRRHLVASLWRGACAVARAPFALLAFLLLRIYWLAWWAVHGTWRGVMGVVALVAWTLRAIARGIQRAIVGAAVAIAGACVAVLRGVGHACATLTRAVVHGLQRVIAAIVGGAVAAARGVWHGVSATWMFAVGSVTTVVALTARTGRRGAQATYRTCATMGHATLDGARALGSTALGAGVAMVRGLGHGVSATSARAVRAGTSLLVHGIHTARRVAHATIDGTQQVTSAIAAAGMAVIHGVRAAASPTWRLLTASARATTTATRTALVAAVRASVLLPTRLRVRIGVPAAIHAVARASTRPVVPRSVAVVGVVGVATAAISLVPRTAVTRPAVEPGSSIVQANAVVVPVQTNAVVAPAPPPTAPIAAPTRSAAAPPLSSPPRRAVRAVARPAVRAVARPADRTAARPAVARTAPANDARPAVEVAVNGVTTDAVRVMWRDTDARSLDRALASVRQATLAFRRCNVQMTAADAAVARCDVAQGAAAARDAAWTIEFRRADERWLIESISTK